MSYHDIYKIEQESELGIPSLAAQSRQKIISQINTKKNWDVVIVGGGIHGAVFARLAALNGLKVLLLEAQDYACATSSRSSKMAHGGLRYLELFDLKQVGEGISAREDLYETAPHLVRPYPFLIPIKKGQSWFKCKLFLGLWFYDRMVQKKALKHSWIAAKDFNFENLTFAKETLDGGFIYYDGIMNDSRLVLANIYSARQEGAGCLNYARVNSLSQQEDGSVEIAWQDILSGHKYETKCGLVVNTTGPWVPMLGRLTKGELATRVAYSQGTHLLFDKQWNGPALFLPLPEKSRYYFIWPHFSGTLVGTTERVVDTLVQDPQPTAEEIQEILNRLEKDVPYLGLNRKNLIYSYAGIRTLPLRGSKKVPGLVSRRHIWHYSQGMLSLIGGKFTTATWTAFEGLKKVFQLANMKQTPSPAEGRMLPGSHNLQEEIDVFQKLCNEKLIPEKIVASCLRRLGSNVRFLFELDPDLIIFADELLKADVLYAMRFDQAETLEDLLRRRLDLEYTPEIALKVLDELCSFLKNEKPEVNWDEQASSYRKRIADLMNLMQK